MTTAAAIIPLGETEGEAYIESAQLEELSAGDFTIFARILQAEAKARKLEVTWAYNMLEDSIRVRWRAER